MKNIVESMLIGEIPMSEFLLKVNRNPSHGLWQRIKNAKEQIKNAFHVVDNKKPWWIQGAEWPRGINSPMQFIDKKRRGEEVHYIFKDVDTGEIRTVIQYY